VTLRIVLFALALVIAPSLARADGDDDKKDARALMQSGVALLKAKDYLGALAVFKDAYRRYPSAKILLNIGTTLKQLGRDADAANAYQRYLDAPDTDPARKPEVESLLAEYDKTLARLKLTVSPNDAEVQINLGEWFVAKEMKLYRLVAGSFTAKVRKPKYAPAERRGDARAMATTDVVINLILEPEEEGLIADDGRRVAPIVGVAAPPPPRSRLGAKVGAHIDALQPGVAAALGVVITIADRIEVDVAALLGPTQGAYVGGTYYILTGRWRPRVSLGAPMFFSDGARFAARAAIGLEVVASRHLSVIADVGGERYFNPEDDIEPWAFVPAVGVHARL
jgi:hypothetical protein